MTVFYYLKEKRLRVEIKDKKGGKADDKWIKMTFTLVKIVFKYLCSEIVNEKLS